MESTEKDTYHYTPLPEPIPITEQKWPEGTVPLVHTRTMTYMQEEYIRDCIEGILMQKTTFPVQVLIHDDASTDKTPDIIREYEEKYPHLIRAYYQTENSHSKSIEEKRGLRKPFDEMCTGKYEALCEGDDYWIYSLKLQEQVEFLERKHDYVLSHTNCDKKYEQKNYYLKNVDPDYSQLDLSTPEKRLNIIIREKLKIRTASVVYRSGLKKKLERTLFKMGDTPRWIQLSQLGKFRYINKSTVVYRISEGTMSRPGTHRNKYEFQLSGAVMRIYFCKKYNYEVPDSLMEKYRRYLDRYILFGGDDRDYIRYLGNVDQKTYSRKMNRSFWLNFFEFSLDNPRQSLALLKKR